MSIRYTVECPTCDAFLISYDEEILELDNDTLVRFQHTSEQNTDCDGYRQIRASEFQEAGVDVVG